MAHTQPLSNADRAGISRTIGAVLTRLIVPAWVLAGAMFKLAEANPKNLPSQILRHAHDAGINIETLLAVLITLEIGIAAVMIFLPRLSRLACIFMLSVFCLVLVNELRMGAKSCGCLGNVPVTPWQMLIIDGALLLGVSLFRPGWMSRFYSPRLNPLAAAVMILVGGAVSFARISAVNDAPPPSAIPDNGGTRLPSTATAPPRPTDPNANPNPKPLPQTWLTPEPSVNGGVAAWVGKPWREIELFQFLHRWPANLDSGKHFVVFYSRTCEHCEAMFWDDLIRPGPVPVTAIEIPDSRTVLTSPHAWQMPAIQHLEMLSLPLGCNWIISPPLALTIQNGQITCAEEGSHKKCFGLE